MKNLILLVLGLFVLTGCGVSEKVYSTGKVVYKGAKTVYVELPVQNDKLEVFDKVVVTYDKARTAMKEEIANQKKKEAVSTSSVQE